ncbi:hypothetical protein K491DRAFT_470770 [Lophiostoma macrostomum CBS 122681]|uniref:polynucleotide adenylyltransferase n=1 Tax=Lophiostoma macrostomum CBS 122681 TaxID=1314788 RepID=A0A6A6T6H4_9PLEO|nr:hypothetical protein K491DRAFT_470770 [Lophiostoma macrostomum CBS 122681]
MPRDSRRRNAPQRALADRVTFGSGNQQDIRKFMFESSHQGPQFPPAQPQNGDSSHPKKKHRKHNRKGRSGNDGESRDAPQPANERNPNPSRRNDNRSRWGPGPEGGPHRAKMRRFPATHERALLQNRDSTGPERTLGVVDGVNKFLNLDDLSASDEEMDLDDGKPVASESSTSDHEERHKVAKVAAANSANGDSVPKWSNPDPYTALPPPAAREHKFDPVALIRKAKNEQASNSSSKPAATDDDFISFDNDDDDVRPPPQAPRGPRLQGGLYIDGHQVAGSLNEVVRAPVLPMEPPRARQPLPQANKRKRGEYDGDILGDWLPVPYMSSTPWLRNDQCPVPDSIKHKNCSNYDKMLMLLHNEICDFYDYVQPRDHEHSIRKKLVRDTMKHLGTQGVFPDPAVEGQLRSFGSFPHKFYLPTADMDLVYVSDVHDQDDNRRMFVPGNVKQVNRLFYEIAHKLRYKGFAEDIQVIGRAKVPIIKFVHRSTRIQCDLSLENKSGLVTQETFARWKHEYSEVFHLFIALVKQFLAMRGLNDVHLGGLGGFSIVCLVYAYLSIHETNKDESINLGRSFLGFLKFYGHDFDLRRSRLVMAPVPQVVRKDDYGIDGRKEKADGLSIQDPNLPTNNISGGSSKAKQVFEAFGKAHDILEDRLSRADLSGNSILGAIIGGNYTSYRDYHDRMRHLSPSAPLRSSNYPGQSST